MSLNEATKKNLRRKSKYVDDVQLHGDIPLFSWMDINLTELCNRTCVFCPRADENFYPNQNLHMSMDLIGKIGGELKDLKYQGAIVLSGFGEPLLHPEILEIVSILSKNARIEIVTNGDHLNREVIGDLLNAGADYLVVSMYDGPHQIEIYTDMFAGVGRDDEFFLLRDRWHSQEDGFGLKLTNRAGTIDVGDQDPVNVTHPCHYPAYSMTVDWNGDVLLCVQDWNKKVKLGNIFSQSLLEVWISSNLSKRRIQLAHGSRKLNPCALCNADGTLHGYNHVRAWGIEK
jgi:radical SAM protein with 4Fe4S-binding SPASM domain